jgi:hypothetical protein
MLRFPIVCGLLLLAACEPASSLPVKVMAILPNRAGTYDTKQVELTTPDSVVHMTGKLLTLVGGAQVELNPADPALGTATSEEQLLDILMKNKGNSVRANFVDKAGVLWPSDFHSWGMTTTYYNFEQAFLYYQRIYDGKPTDELKDIKVLYWAGYKDLTNGSELELRDNAIYFSPIKAFMILPFEKLQKVPLSLNLGVVGHEFAHLVFSKKVFSGASIPAPLSSWTLTPFNYLKAMDEGFADFHGYGVTCATGSTGSGCKASLLSDSFDDKEQIAARDITDPTKCMTAELRSAIHNFQPGQFLGAGLHYKLGTLIAAALYQASAPLGKEDLIQKALIASLNDENKPGFRQRVNLYLQSPQSFTPELVIETIAAHVTDPDLRKQVCKQLSDRLQIECVSFPCMVGGVSQIPSCDNATRGISCPTLPPE